MILRDMISIISFWITGLFNLSWLCISHLEISGSYFACKQSSYVESLAAALFKGIFSILFGIIAWHNSLAVMPCLATSCMLLCISITIFLLSSQNTENLASHHQHSLKVFWRLSIALWWQEEAWYFSNMSSLFQLENPDCMKALPVYLVKIVCPQKLYNSRNKSTPSLASE